MRNMRFGGRKWVLFLANRNIIGANRKWNIDQCANPSSEMGNKSIPMLETAEMQVSLDSFKSKVMCECRGGRYGGR